MTKFTLTDGTVEKYDIVGTLDDNWLAQHNIKINQTWQKSIVKCEIGTHVTSIGGFVFTMFSGNEIVVPDSVLTLGQDCFQYCTLQTIHFLDTCKITEIPIECFYSSSFSDQLILPESISSINSSGFARVSNASITFKGKMTNIVPEAFDGNNMTLTFMQNTKADILSMSENPRYPIDVSTPSVIHCTDGDLIV